MSFEAVAPPKVVEQLNYKTIIQRVIQEDGGSLKLSPDEIAAGAKLTVKQNRQWQAARQRRSHNERA